MSAALGLENLVTENEPDLITIPLIINGREKLTSLVFPVASPDEVGRTIWESSSALRPEVLEAIDAAQGAFPGWSATKPAFRRDILLRAADILETHTSEYQTYMKQETGARDVFAKFNITTSCEIIRDVAGRISGALSGAAPICEDAGTHALVVKEPYGVVLSIAPWNAPYILGIRSVVYALAAGNTCVLKGSELSPRCFWAIGTLFLQAGLPDGCLNVLYHRTADAADITRLIIEHPAVKKINFTGSTAVGSIIAEIAGRNLKPVLMELGGKNSAIVCEDANLGKAAQQCSLGAFLHGGQICMSTERILVHQSIVEPFTRELKKAIATTFNDTDETQSLAQPAGFKKVTSLVHDALAKGAVLVQGKSPTPTLATADIHSSTTISSSTSSLSQIQPIVLGGVTKDMAIYNTESFGPCVSLIPVCSDEEAIAIANDTDYGLSGAVFTEDLARGFSVARRVESGAVHINSMSVHDEAGLPHGGVKKSGWGRFNSDAGLNEFLRTKTITFRTGH